MCDCCFVQDDGGDIDVDEFMKGIREPLHLERVPENKIKCTYIPVRLAPGIHTDIILELSAEVPGISECELRIMQASTLTEIRRKVSCTVLTPEQYKTVSKEVEMATPDLEAEGTFSLLSEGVVNTGRTLENDEIGEFGKKPKETNLGEDEVKEIHSLPIVHGTYYNPRNKKLYYDQDFTKVVVNSNYSINECENETNAHCKDTFFDLEARGMYTTEILKKEVEAMERYSSMMITANDMEEEDDEEDAGENNEYKHQEKSISNDSRLSSVIEDEREMSTPFINQKVTDLLQVDTGLESIVESEGGDSGSSLP